jgi:hypothetical protein
MHHAALLALVLFLGGCTSYQAARVEVFHDTQAREGESGMVAAIDFARRAGRMGHLYGHRVEFLTEPGIQRAHFQQKLRKNPEAWRVTWVTPQGEHELMVVVVGRDKDAELEILRPHGPKAPRPGRAQTRHPELGDPLGNLKGLSHQVFLRSDGSVRLPE